MPLSATTCLYAGQAPPTTPIGEDSQLSTQDYHAEAQFCSGRQNQTRQQIEQKEVTSVLIKHGVGTNIAGWSTTWKRVEKHFVRARDGLTKIQQ